MASWVDVCLNNLQAAKLLLEKNCYRSSISRSYYTAYSATTAVLLNKGVVFGGAWEDHPKHGVLQSLVKNHLRLDRRTQREVLTSLGALRTARVQADYQPGLSVNKELALKMYFQAKKVVSYLEI